MSKKIKFNAVQSKNIGTGQVTDIPAISGKNYDQDIANINNDLTEVKEDIIQLNDTKADKSALAETDFSLDMLWKLSKGQTYDIQTKVESGMNVPPKGAKYETLLDVRGKSEQFSTNGYNLLPYPYSDTTVTRNGITFTDNGDGTITLNGTSTSEVTFSFNPNSNKVFLNLKNVKLKWFFSYYADYGINLQADIYDSNDVYIYTTQQSVSSYYDDAYYFKNCRIRIASAGVSVNNLRIYPMLCVDSATNYEPYTGGIPVPNPDYPQEITSVEELNFYKANEPFIDIIENSNIESNGKITTVSTSLYYLAIIPCGEGRTVKGVWGAFSEYPQTNSYAIGNIRYLTTAETPKGTKYIAVRGSYNSSETYQLDNKTFNLPMDTSSFVVEKKTIIPPFPLNGIGDYRDFADVDKGVWVKKNKSINIDDINLTLHSSNAFWKDFEFDDIETIISVTTKTLAISDQYHAVAPIDFSQYIVGTMAQYASDIGIRFCNGSTTVKPTGTMIYVSKTPTETPINPTDLEYLKSLSIMETENNILTITDQNGNDISYLMEYIIKLNEVN